MTTRQAELIEAMINSVFDTLSYQEAYAELLDSCSDYVIPDPVVPAMQTPTVTVSATSTATPPPPNTPKPLGPDWWRERKDEALKEQIQIIADQNKKIAALQKQIAEDKEHWENKAAIDDGVRKHNKELVAANGEIYEALQKHNLLSTEQSLVENIKSVIQTCSQLSDEIERAGAKLHFRSDMIVKTEEVLRDHGLYQADLGGLAKNVKNVALMCEERGKRIAEQEEKIKDLRSQLNTSISASNQILNALNENDLRQQSGSLADNVVWVVKQCVTQDKQIGMLNEWVHERDEQIHELNKRVEERDKKIEEFRKVVRNRNDEIERLKNTIGFLERVSEARKQFNDTDRAVNHKKTVEIEELTKCLVVAGKKRKAIVDVGNNMREVLRGIISNNAMSHSEAQMGQHAIQLWEDNTLP